MWTRRQLLTALGAAGAVGVPRAARAETPDGLRFLFFWAGGGWDPTRCLTPVLDVPTIATEPDAAVVEVAGLPFVDHPDRPSVRTFFDENAHRTAVIEGMLVRSVNHRVCERLVATGASQPGLTDWATQLGAAWADAVAVPSLVISGPSSPGALHRYSAVLGGSEQMQGLLDGRVFARGDVLVETPSRRSHDLLEAFLADRISERHANADPAVATMLDAYRQGWDRASRLAAGMEGYRLRGGLIDTQVDSAVTALSLGVARCVTIARSGFDTHIQNHLQSDLHEAFFSALMRLMRALDVVPGHHAPRLSDETVVVVVSEMGRTPYENFSFGKDHWPYTPAMIIGPGVRPGRVGGVDDSLNGLPISLTTGSTDNGDTVVTPEHLGATVAALGEVTLEGGTPVDPIEAILA
jgi:uncharacterized protein (DUF1501 family)